MLGGVLRRQIRRAKTLTEGTYDGTPLEDVCGRVHVRPPDEELPVAGPILVINATLDDGSGESMVLEAKRALRGEKAHVELDGKVVDADIDVSLAGGLDEAFVVYTVELEDPEVDIVLRAELNPGRALLDTLLGGLFG